jgi:hypothetical protein
MRSEKIERGKYNEKLSGSKLASLKVVEWLAEGNPNKISTELGRLPR